MQFIYFYTFCCVPESYKRINLQPTTLLPALGTVVELLYAVSSYGISTDILPLDENGRVMDGSFLHELSEQRKLEEKIRQQKSSSLIIEYPIQRDVLLGRGRQFQDFPGNIRLMQLVKHRGKDYDEANKGGKSVYITEIVHTIHQMGGRFLKKTTASKDGAVIFLWEEADIATAHKKVNNCFQSRKRQQSTLF